MRARLFASENRKWWTLGAVSFGLFMIMLDNTVVNVALPAMQRSLHVKTNELEWVIVAYALTFATLMLTGGKLADYFGRRRLFMIGLVVFTLSSLACGLSENAGSLIGARAVQGVGAALMNPATLGIITATFPPRQRGMAIGIWAGTSAIALAIGPLLGGLLVEKVNWNWIFFINVPVGAVAIAVAAWAIDETRDMSEQQRLDIPGLLSSGIGLFALTYGLIESNTYGWTSPRILALFGVAALALGVFVLLEQRQRSPMLDLSLFRNRTVTGANLAVLLVALALFGVFFYNSLFFQTVLGYSPIETGAMFLPWTLLIAIVSPLAGRLADRLGSRWLVGTGMTLVCSALLVFAQLDQHATYLDILPGLLLGGLGMGLTISPTTTAAMAAMPVDKAGVGSAVLNASRQLGGSLGIAVLGSIVASAVHVPRVAPAFGEQFVQGYQRALYTGAGFAALGAVLSVVLIRQVHRHERAPAAEVRPGPASA
jgi:EmrB/QacA subfamily drug resistance transporter